MLLFVRGKYWGGSLGNEGGGDRIPVFCAAQPSESQAGALRVRLAGTGLDRPEPGSKPSWLLPSLLFQDLFLQESLEPWAPMERTLLEGECGCDVSC